METESLGKIYEDGEIIVKQGGIGDCMFVIQEGQVEVILEKDGQNIKVGALNQGDFFGEMALFEREPRGATIRATGKTRVLMIDKRTLLRRLQGDPSLAFRLVEKMSGRIRELNDRLAKAQLQD